MRTTVVELPVDGDCIGKDLSGKTVLGRKPATGRAQICWESCTNHLAKDAIATVIRITTGLNFVMLLV
jgi:hypothetical protein